MLNFGALVQQSITKIEGREAIFVSVLQLQTISSKALESRCGPYFSTFPQTFFTEM
jgi:hypothetical protein